MIGRDIRTFVAFSRDQDTDIARILVSCNWCEYQKTYMIGDHENAMMMATAAEADMANHIHENSDSHNNFNVDIDIVEPVKHIDVEVTISGTESGA